MTKPTQRAVRIWILGVMNRQRSFVGDNADQEADIAVKSSLLAFVERFPAAAFCTASMDAVCASVARWSEPNVIKALDVWWRANDSNTGVSLPIEAQEAPVSDEAKQWLAGWYRANDEDHAVRALDLIRAKSNEAFGYLVRRDTRASSMAVLRKWVAPSGDGLAMEWDDPDGIEWLFQKARGGLRDMDGVLGMMTLGVAYRALVTAVRIHAPQHLWIVDPKRLREIDGPAVGPIIPVQSSVVEASPGLFE